MGEGVSKDFGAAADYLRAAACKRDSTGMYCYAVALQHGRGVDTNHARAANSFRGAASLGHPLAIIQYALYLENERGDMTEAAKYFKKAAELHLELESFVCIPGFPSGFPFSGPVAKWCFIGGVRLYAALKYGLCLQKGLGVERNESLSRLYLQEVQRIGDVDTFRNLGIAFWYGGDFIVNKAEGVRWFRMAAELGDRFSRIPLAISYERGEGVKSDPATALGLYALEAKERDAYAALNMGYFYWRGGFAKNRDEDSGSPAKNEDEARRYWRIGGFDVPATPLGKLPTVVENVPPEDFVNCERIVDRDEERRKHAMDQVNEDLWSRDSSTRRSDRYCSQGNTNFQYGRGFELWNSDRDRAIEEIVTRDGRSVREVLKSPPEPHDLAMLVADGIILQGERCQFSEQDPAHARLMCFGSKKEGQFGGLDACHNMRTLFATCVALYTAESFLYRTVSQFLRESPNGDAKTGKLLGLYI
jgi:TPR repeat protein